MKSYLFKKRWVRRSRLICYLLFGFYPYPINRKTLWDSTSLVLKEAILKWINKNMVVLEIGTGDIGLLSNYIDRKRDVDITAIDICIEFVENAKKNKKNESKIKFISSDLFSKIEKNKKFDIIFSNPPYVKTSMINPDDHIHYHGFKKKEMLFYASDGGEFGTSLISRIINESSLFLNQNGSLLIGYNQNHIDEKLIKEIIDHSKFYLFETLCSHRTTCKVIILKLKKEKNE